jgi:predicted secreted protein
MDRKKIITIVLAVIAASFLLWGFLYSEESQEFTYRENTEIKNVKPKKPIKIKLKRTSGGKYSWDLTGDDVDEIVKTDKQLRNQLGIK